MALAASAPVLIVVVTAAIAAVGPRTRRAPPEELALGEVVRAHKSAVKVCYQRVLRHEPTLRIPKMITRLQIERGGRVAQVSFGGAAPADDALGACLSQAIGQWTFPPSDWDYRFEFPIVWSAN